MAKLLFQHIAEDFKSHQSNVLLVENNDGFLFREDNILELREYGIVIVPGSMMQKRIRFELRDLDTILVLLSNDNSTYLEDIKEKSVTTDFFLEKYLNGYHIPSIMNLDKVLLEKLFLDKEVVKLSKQQTIDKIQKIKVADKNNQTETFDVNDFIQSLDKELNNSVLNWSSICRLISMATLKTIGTKKFDEVILHINNANAHFQKNIEESYQQTKNSSAVKKPQIVSKILDYLNFNFREEKIALIVVDGLAFWQYELLKEKLHNIKNEEVIYSWIPSITQLSRQAIFRGDIPQTDYKQGPISEEKLWKSYWKSKGVNEFEIKYLHEKSQLNNLAAISKFALVFKDLDEKMHSSTDYKDLLKLTENWIERSQITMVIEQLLQNRFRIFLTTDHGNIQAKGWRGLQGREKLGTNKSGSRSERHIEYTEKWLSDEFMQNNPELKDSVVMEEQAIYFKTDLSFSRKETLVTHGGAHLLEVLIPFIEISND